MTKSEYETTQSQIMLLAGLVRSLPIQEFIDTADRMDTVAPFTDPTLYRMGAKKLGMVLRCARGLLAFQRALPPFEEWQRAEQEAAALAQAAGGHVEPGVGFVRDES